jgi:hydrogenase maturation protein HypF
VTKSVSVRVTGVVQGVGFRPFVYNLANRMGVRGWVLNSAEGVFIGAEGQAEVVDAFVRAVREEAPPMSVVESVEATEVEPAGFADFEIRESVEAPGAMTLVSPDIATCSACEAELRDPGDERYRYPFINCTNCGPRFTIIEDVPYDRPVTTMRDFPMCPSCGAEYLDPADRRFHAQPNACPVCGPRLYLNAPGVPDDFAWRPEVETVPRANRDADVERARTDAIVAEAERLLRDGRIVAIKGLGGFHLACDATNEDAVRTLRERKHRKGKPLAVMVPDIVTARELGEVGPAEEELLTGTVRPIVLLRLRRPGCAAPGGSGAQTGFAGDPSAPLTAPPSPASPPPAAELAADPPGAAHPTVTRLAPSVTGPLAEVGVMLPYTPLQHVLLADLSVPLVMTSGNLSEEPIATGNAEALERLAGIADAFLLNDRGIYSRYDDSVTRVVGEDVELVRRARGYAPFPLTLPFETPVPILGAGSEQKNTFTLLKDGYAFVSQHIGDLENAETLAAYGETLALYERLFRITPEVVAYDLHPEYLSTKFALGLDIMKVGVQHHHAHIVGVTAEHDVRHPVVGVAFDGTGYGTDGHIWGGEFLIADWRGFTRFAHLREVPMPGGSAAIRRPARMALGLLAGIDRGLLNHPGTQSLLARITENERDVMLTMIGRGFNSPLTSSMGRLFDAVAAILGVRVDADYEGQAAIELEAIADTSAEGSYEFALVGSGPVVLDPEPVLRALLDDVASGVPSPAISSRFHRAVVGAIVRVARSAAAETGSPDVALAGGVFLNRLVLGGAVRGLSAAGLRPLTHRRLPTNDGAISYGQAIVAWARREES